MAHLFKVLNNKSEYSSVVGPAIIVKNVSGGPFEVDDDGRVLSHNTVAAIDDSCKLCKAGIASGKLVVVHEIAKQSPPKQKAKVSNLSLEVNQEQVDDKEQTVASTEDAESVQ